MPIVAAGGAAISVAANFDDAMSQVQGALGDASADTEGLRQLALQLGSDTVFSATEAAQAMVDQWTNKGSADLICISNRQSNCDHCHNTYRRTEVF